MTSWGAGSAAEQSACFGWFAGYPYLLQNLVQSWSASSIDAIHQKYAEHMEGVRQFLLNLGTLMLRVEEVLAHHEEFPLIYELKGLGIIPEGPLE